MKKILCFIVVLTLALSFTAFASEFRLDSCSITNNATASSIEENVINLEFTENVQFTSVLTTTVTKDGMGLDGSEFSAVIGSAPNVVEVKINTLEYGSTYVINYGAYSNGSTLVVDNPATITFTVEPAPEIVIEKTAIISGIETGVIVTDSVSTEVKTGSLTGFMLDVKNTTASDKEVTVVCALYDANGLLRKIVSSSKTVLADAEDQIAVGTEIPATSDSGVAFTGGKSKAKIFVWDNMSNKFPYVTSFDYSIVTP